MFQKIIEEISQELNIKYTYLSKDWIIKLEKDNKISYIVGYKFALNNHALGIILDDKYALYEVLNNLKIPVCTHHIIYSTTNKKRYAKESNSYQTLIDYFNKYNKNVVIKPNTGSLGNGVHHITNIDDLINYSNKLLQKHVSISLSPYYDAINEYRIIVLKDKIKLIYRKIKPIIYGDGKSSIQDLLIKFNTNYFKDKNLPTTILKKNEKYIYDWRFNLSKGSMCTLEIDSNIKTDLTKLALNISHKLNLGFASIDVLELKDHSLKVVEINSGIMLNNAINDLPNGYNIAKDIYKEAILELFK